MNSKEATIATTFIGIDPGLGGAIASISPAGTIELHDCPVLSIGKKIKFNASKMAALLLKYQKTNSCLQVGLEKIHSMPGQGVASTFTFGEGFGVWIGILAALSIPHQLINPQTWKTSMMQGEAKTKDASRLVAMRLFPQVSDRLQLKKHHGRADALLIAEFLRRQYICT